MLRVGGLLIKLRPGFMLFLRFIELTNNGKKPVTWTTSDPDIALVAGNGCFPVQMVPNASFQVISQEILPDVPDQGVFPVSKKGGMEMPDDQQDPEHPVIRVVYGDITRLSVDAIVNAANRGLSGGGGVDGAIHRAAGPRLAECCRRIGGCETGCAKITPGFGLPARFVIHTVGPVWSGGGKGEDDLLAACYRNSLRCADEAGCRSIAFPAISTGAYGFPAERAARVALTSIREYFNGVTGIREVLLVCINEQCFESYTRLLTP